MDMSRGSKFKDGIRIAAAAYLIYLGVKIISDVWKGTNEEHQILFVIFGIVFIAVGAWIGLWSVKSLMKESGESEGVSENGSEKEERGRSGAETDTVTAKADPAQLESKASDMKEMDTEKTASERNSAEQTGPEKTGSEMSAKQESGSGQTDLKQGE